MEIKVSIIVVTYKRLNYLKLAVESLLAQTYKFAELLIIGDGHQQDVEEYVISLNSPNIFYFYVEHCGYPAKARNFGIGKCKGSFIAFCDDDDMWLNNKLEKQMTIFSENQNIALCCTNRNIINADGDRLSTKSLNRIPSKFNLGNLLVSNYVSYSSVVVKKAVFEKTGLFPDDIQFKAIEDYHLWIRIALFYEIYFLNEPLILYRLHETNITEKLSYGARKNIKLFKDLFSKFKFKLSDEIKAFTTAYTKLLIYKLLGK